MFAVLYQMEPLLPPVSIVMILCRILDTCMLSDTLRTTLLQKRESGRSQTCLLLIHPLLLNVGYGYTYIYPYPTFSNVSAMFFAGL